MIEDTADGQQLFNCVAVIQKRYSEIIVKVILERRTVGHSGHLSGIVFLINAISLNGSLGRRLHEHPLPNDSLEHCILSPAFPIESYSLLLSSSSNHTDSTYTTI